ncbi:MAG TPA: protein kinase, partial [Gemmatimonadaceae bacterium]|nr:protein kinase [Gemmatimonadaceae bacterium]
KTTASLQHPHILPLFDSGATDGFLYYVMPFLDGETLREKLNRETQLGVGEAVRIARDVADALDYAHRHGVIHRDIKPENILLHDGRPIVADFGIALAVSAAASGRMTETGLSLGTPQYMSPEQATAEKQITARSDIYSLGSVLYEMLSGNPPHTGASAQQIIMKIIAEPVEPVTRFRKSVPQNVAAALAQSLEKLPADRFESAKAFADALGNPGFRAGEPGSAGAATAARARGWALATALLVVGVVIGATAVSWRRGAVSGMSSRRAPMIHATVDLPPDTPLALRSQPVIGFSSPVVALSPDGSLLAYVVQTTSGTMINTRELATGEVRSLAGTEGTIHAFFSPDGEWIGFLTHDHVKKIPRAGGTAATLCEAEEPVLAWWVRPDLIYFREGGSILSRVSAEGGKGERMLRPGEPSFGQVSDILPDGQTVLADRMSSSFGGDHMDIVATDVRTRKTTMVVHSGYGARYVAPGYLLFARNSNIVAMRFDARTRAVSGEPVTVAANATQESLFGIVHAAASNNGILAYVPGGDLSVGKLAWADRRGAVEYLDAPERVYGQIDLAPDGQHIAVHAMDVHDYIWVWNTARREGQRVVSAEAEGFPVWSYDGRRLGGSILGAHMHTVIHDAAPVAQIGAGVPVDGSGLAPAAFSPVGDVLAFHASLSPFRIGFVGLGQPTRATMFDAAFIGFSPDGRWMTYSASARTGASEVFIASFPDGKIVGQVSPAGGIEPRWKPSGELYYRNGHRWYATHVATAPEPRWNPPHLVFDVEFIDTPGMSYDVSPDGQRLLVVKLARAVTTSRIELVTNWTDLVERQTRRGK